MLGKNQIESIKPLDNFKHLDVLDLHENRLQKLKEFQVLSLFVSSTSPITLLKSSKVSMDSHPLWKSILGRTKLEELEKPMD
jgi:Leucine-rich repeat (LRR) protein